MSSSSLFRPPFFAATTKSLPLLCSHFWSYGKMQVPEGYMADTPTSAAKVWAFLKPILEYGKEDRDSPDFRWHKYLVRTVVINIVATIIAWRATMIMLEFQARGGPHAGSNGPGPPPGLVPLPTDTPDAEF